MKIALTAALAVCVSVVASAQQLPAPPINHGILSGSVSDMAGAPVPGAKILISGGGVKREAASGEDGTYRAALPPGTYRIEVSAEGFKNVQEVAYAFAGGEQAKNFVLSVGAIVCTVYVKVPPKKAARSKMARRRR